MKPVHISLCSFFRKDVIAKDDQDLIAFKKLESKNSKILSVTSFLFYFLEFYDASISAINYE